ncbi:MAG: hypothetical protein P8J33_00120 [Pirellulaceae bacterium]|nr:hypothetical protein [Pirellulaceae bacterium]
MNLSQTPFEKFSADCQEAGLEPALGNLADYLIEQARFHELFEVRKLQLRQRLGLPIEKWQAIDELAPEKGQALESGLLEICRDVGARFMQIGQVMNGWQYLEPVGDRPAVAALLKEVEPTDENVEELIQISVGQGIQPEMGFQLVLDRFGTCSSITTYESQLAMQPLEVRRGPAGQLVEHLYHELVGRIQQAISEVEGEVPADCGLTDLMTERDWLFEGLNHHIDTTHLASTLRIAKILDEPALIGKAIELAEYGKRLHEDFHYQGQTPFEAIYADTLEFLQALNGQDAEPAISRLAAVAAAQSETGNLDAAVWYVYLLDRLEMGVEATQVYLDLVHVQQAEGMISEDICPNLTTLASKYGCYEIAQKRLLEQGDLLSYATITAIERQSL